MVIGRGLQAENHPESMLHFECGRLNQKLLEALIDIIPLCKVLPAAVPKKALCRSSAISSPTIKY